MEKPLSDTVQSLSYKLEQPGGNILINVDTGNTEIAPEAVQRVCKTATPENVKGAVQEANEISRLALNADRNRLGQAATNLGNEQDDQGQLKINPGSSNILLHCSTDERFLETLESYNSGKMKERSEEGFSRIGHKMKKLNVNIENVAEVNQTKEAIKKRYHRYSIKI